MAADGAARRTFAGPPTPGLPCGLMRSALVMLLCVLAGASAWAKEPSATPAQAADRVLAATRAKDTASLRALGSAAVPDPWLVADELCARGEHDAAVLFGRETSVADELEGYVAARRGAAHDGAERKLLQTVEKARDAGASAEVLALTDSVDLTAPSVAGIRLMTCRSIALLHANQLAKAEQALEAARDAAERIGWRRETAALLTASSRIKLHRGDVQGAGSALTRVVAIREAIGDPRELIVALVALGNFKSELGAFADAQDAYVRALALAESSGNRHSLGVLYENISLVHYLLGEHARALEMANVSLAIRTELGDGRGVTRMTARIAGIHESTGNYAEALDYAKRALAQQEARGNAADAAITLGQIGSILRFLGEYEAALEHLRRGLQLAQTSGNVAGEATILANIGVVHYRRGDYPKALAHARRALALYSRIDDRRGQAFALGHVGMSHDALGEYPEALRSYERSLELRKATRDRQGMAAVLVNLGNVYAKTGDRVRALALFEQAYALQSEMGDRQGAAVALSNMGNLHHELGDHEEALTFYERARTTREGIGDVAGAATTLGNIAVMYEFLGDTERALTTARRALAMYESIGGRAAIASARGNVGVLRLKSGDAAGIEDLEKAIRDARWLRATPLLVRLLSDVGLHWLEQGEPQRALERAREASRELQDVFSGLEGLGGSLGATARAQHSDVYAVGALAAVQLERTAEALTFIEDGRAGALLEALGGRQSMRWTDLPAELRQLESKAHAEHAAARASYVAALETGNLRATRSAAETLDRTVAVLRTVTERIQREAKREAGVFYPRAAPVEEIQGRLAPGHVLVLYGFCLDEVVAFVLTRDEVRVVSLGAAMPIVELCALARFDDRTEDAAARIAKLAARLVAPLKLDAATQLVLVSPDGPLGYVPFGALFELPVVLTPSGSAYVWQRDVQQPVDATKVLAVGDPDYGSVSDKAREVYARGRRLAPLPATRKEATQIGSVALLGADANEAALRKALAGEGYWRAVHLACHGIVDPERPAISALALSAADGEDGFLTCLEVLRMRIPADLVVLSACATGTGQLVASEGIVGLTRAFMYAGASRVVCSLWDVDDAATQAFMLKFYELWNTGAGVSAAEALRGAQAHVRGQAKWKHPYYWAAWVLWGLP